MGKVIRGPMRAAELEVCLCVNPGSEQAAASTGARFLQHIWQVQNHSIYKIICNVVEGKLQNGKDFDFF